MQIKPVSCKFDRFSRSLSSQKAGSLEVRLAQSEEEIKEAQALRYKVFFEECGAMPDEETARLKRDVSPIDDYCDVLLVIDHSCNKIVGTYRFMLREAALCYGKYFTSSEYDITKLVDCSGQIMELGRSCVHQDYRTRPTMQLLWAGIEEYIRANNVDICFGCASFGGTDIGAYKQALSYLHYNHLAPEDIRVKALPTGYQAMNLLPREEVDEREAMRQLPPLVKGYLRLGAYVGEGAFLDKPFNSIDVCIIVKTQRISERYTQWYGSRKRQQ